MPHPELAGFPVIVELDVAWGEMDAYAHVNNVVYFRYFENARIAYLDRVGWSASKEADGRGPILHSTSARFRKPVSYPDHLWVGARATDIQPDRVTFEFRLVSEKFNAVACDGAWDRRELRLPRRREVPDSRRGATGDRGVGGAGVTGIDDFRFAIDDWKTERQPGFQSSIANLKSEI